MKLIMFVASLALVVAGTSGCKTAPKPTVKVDAPPKAVIYNETVRVEDQDAGNLGNLGIPREDDAQQVIQFALTLSGAGRHLHAAEFLEEAATKFASRNNELAIACLAGAANEYLLAGDANAMPAFRNAIRRLASAANRYQMASFDQNFLTLLCLGAIANGEVQPADKELTPKSIRELYPIFSVSSAR